VAGHASPEGPAPQPRRRAGRLLSALVLLALAGSFWAYRSPLFRLEQVEVTGAYRLTPAQVMALAGLEKGAFRFAHPSWSVESAVRRDPLVKEAEAVWQGQRLTVAVTEREPVGLIRYHERFYLTLDHEGRILEQVDLGRGPDLPVITGTTISSALRGQQLQHPGLADALFLLSQMAEKYRRQVSEVAVAEDRSLTLFMEGGATVAFGTLPPGKERAAVVERRLETFGGLWQRLPKRRTGCRIDLRVDQHPTAAGCE
jgi:cell division septal protein FtsQ